MRSSSPSTSHCTLPNIKVQHREAKKKTIRRRRIDLKCGCTYYLSINCVNHGFSHRGTYHCSSSREWRLYLDNNKSPIFQDHQPREPTIPHGDRHHNNKDTIQLQPSESIGDTQMFSNLSSLDELTTSDIAFLESLQDPINDVFE
ncbi:TrAP protein [Spilanthes yellow vein virus]|uniref:Transcriptional activator protein n=1 Tax=Spilanthes yellow vein virus TaxID=390439 RepID=A5H167_9GEMI|nr:TrAP protein [Spilanthes yellow vein virus]ABG26026.1 TrAP protein [Spilanthes yellow vein virus]